RIEAINKSALRIGSSSWFGLADPHCTKCDCKSFLHLRRVPEKDEGRSRLRRLLAANKLNDSRGGFRRVLFVHAQSPRQIECCAELGRRASEGESACPHRLLLRPGRTRDANDAGTR